MLITLKWRKPHKIIVKNSLHKNNLPFTRLNIYHFNKPKKLDYHFLMLSDFRFLLLPEPIQRTVSISLEQPKTKKENENPWELELLLQLHDGSSKHNRLGFPSENQIWWRITMQWTHMHVLSQIDENLLHHQLLIRNPMTFFFSLFFIYKQF